MFLTIALFDDRAALDDLDRRIERLEWRDGRGSAGPSAAGVKRNEQADLTGAAGRAVRDIVMDALATHPVVRAAARPRRFSPPIVSRTRPGGQYGSHVDNAIMGRGAGKLRADLAFTCFLSDPRNYEGGELVVHTVGSSLPAKGRRGEMVLYPASHLHEVRPVTSGERIAAIGWIESMVADPSQRELLFDLDNLRASLRKAHEPQSPELLTLDRTIANLMRMWAQV